jgi:hypothetical protein
MSLGVAYEGNFNSQNSNRSFFALSLGIFLKEPTTNKIPTALPRVRGARD